MKPLWVGGQWICDDSTKALEMKHVMMGGEGYRSVQNSVTSFIEPPLIDKTTHLIDITNKN